MTPPTLSNQPVLVRSAGVQFQSPPTIHGPTRLLIVKAADLRRPRLLSEWIPPSLASLKQ